MFLQCLCGHVMNDIASPNEVQHLLISDAVMERMQDLVDREVAAEGAEDLWPEHWEESGAIPTWKCHHCQRLLVGVGGKPEDIVVYKVEQKGIAGGA